jgi:hypothetical protein
MPDTFISAESLSDRRPLNSAGNKSVKDLWNAHRKAWKAFSAAMDAEDDAMERALPHLPARPESLSRELELVEGGSKIFKLDENLIAEMVDANLLTSDEANSLRTELRGWEAACEAVKDAHGRREAKAALKAAERRYLAAEEAFATAPVRSPADAVLKLRFALEAMDGEARADTPEAQALQTALRGLQKLN